MSKFPMLELLRSQEHNYHKTTVMPFVEDILRTENRVLHLVQENASLRKTLASIATGIGEKVFENILYRLGQAAVEKVILAVQAPNKVFTVRFSADDIWGFNHDSIQRKLLMAWRDQCLPRLSLSVGHMRPDDTVAIKTLRFKIPELNYNCSMLEEK